jgi:hypothetical protein
MQRRALLQRSLLAAAAAAAAAAPVSAWALYDPKPHALLALAPGAWSGTLTYRDYSRPDQWVTLPCKLSVALTAPSELALFYVFDDGPTKTVHSYERMAFDFTANRLSWTSGIAKPSASQHTITGASAENDAAQLQFERAEEGRTDRYKLEVRKNTWLLSKVEVAASGAQTLRNTFELRRSEGA